MNYRERPSRVGPSFISAALAGLVVGTLQLGCGGGLSSDDATGSNPPGTGTGGSAGIIGGGSGGSTVITEGCTDCIDPGTKGVHRLNDAEYNNTVQDLFEDPSLAPARGWLPGEGYGFDNIAEVLRINDGQFEKYFNAAASLAAGVFTRPDQVAKIVTCAQGGTCATDIANALGLRVWRRPLLAAELTSMVGVYDRAIAQGLDHNGAVKELLTAFLASPEFLYRMEFDPDPTSVAQHDLSHYDMASRLSYFLWSSTPDDALLAQAANGQLQDPATLNAAVDRMLADGKSNRLVMNFFGQWMDVRGVPGHSAVPETYPEWSVDLANSMATEAYSYFSEFLHSDLPWTQFISADFNYVDARLATHYGITEPVTGVQRVVKTDDQRMGFLGLGAFLTASSLPTRTSPTSRGRRVLSDLLCTPPPDPPPDVQAQVDELLMQEEQNPSPTTSAAQDIRAFLDQHRADPGCAACHSIFDPYGMALENFDGIGKWRTAYPSGNPVDPSTQLLDGTVLNGLPDVVAAISADPRLSSCVTEKMFIYGLGRGTLPTDNPYLATITARWTNAANGTQTLKRLLQELVTSAPFRTRHGGT
jgi:hypothetical protein